MDEETSRWKYAAGHSRAHVSSKNDADGKIPCVSGRSGSRGYRTIQGVSSVENRTTHSGSVGRSNGEAGKTPGSSSDSKGPSVVRTATAFVSRPIFAVSVGLNSVTAAMIDAGSGRGLDPIGPTAAVIARGETTGAEIAIGMTPELGEMNGAAIATGMIIGPGEMNGAAIDAIRSTGTTDSARASMIGAVHAVMNVERSAMPVGQRGISTGAGIATGGMIAAMGVVRGTRAVSSDTTIRWITSPGGATALTGTMIGTVGIVTGTTIGTTIAFSR